MRLRGVLPLVGHMTAAFVTLCVGGATCLLNKTSGLRAAVFVLTNQFL